MHATSNGRARKSLADQIDRLDAMIDGLADGLNEAVAAAVQEAVRAVLAEVLTHPELRARFAAPPKPESTPSPVRQLWRWAAAKCHAVQAAAAVVVARLAGAARRGQRQVTGAITRVAGGLLFRLAWGLGWIGRGRAFLTSRTSLFAVGFALGHAASHALPGWWAIAGAVLGGGLWWTWPAGGLPFWPRP